jgi:hypothetical protein
VRRTHRSGLRLPDRLRPSTKAAYGAHRQRAIPYGLVASQIGISSAPCELEANPQYGRDPDDAGQCRPTRPSATAPPTASCVVPSALQRVGATGHRCSDQDPVDDLAATGCCDFARLATRGGRCRGDSGMAQCVDLADRVACSADCDGTQPRRPRRQSRSVHLRYRRTCPPIRL